MRQRNLQVRALVQHAAIDQVTGRDRGVERIAEDVGEIERIETLAANRSIGVQEYRQVQRLDAPENGRNWGPRSRVPSTLQPR